MPINVQCSSCKKPLRAPDHLAGKRARCKCGAVVVIPQAQAVTMPAELDLSVGLPADPPSVSSNDPAQTNAAPQPGSACPNCHADLAPGTVLCTACGFNLQSGQQFSVSTGEDRVAPAASPKPRSGRAGGGLKTILPKCVIVAVALGLIAFAVRQGLDFRAHQQASAAPAKVNTGMTVQQVVTALGKPPTEVRVSMVEEASDSTASSLHENTIPYQDDFINQVDPKLIAKGFVFVYRYTKRDVLEIEFSPAGRVKSCELIDPLAEQGR